MSIALMLTSLIMPDVSFSFNVLSETPLEETAFSKLLVTDIFRIGSLTVWFNSSLNESSREYSSPGIICVGRYHFYVAKNLLLQFDFLLMCP